MLFLPQFPRWQCTNTDSCTSSESASEIRLSWPSFIEYSGQPLDRSWTPGQPQLNPSNVNTEYDSASEQSIPHTFKIDFKGLHLTKIQNEGNCITSRKQEGLRMSLDLLKDSPMAIQKYVLDRCLKAKNFKYVAEVAEQYIEERSRRSKKRKPSNKHVDARIYRQS